MTEHRVGTRDEWLAERKELLDAEKAHFRQKDELARRRQELPWVPVEKEYRFETDEGTMSLAELFDGRSQLLVYHFMFGFGYRVDEENPGCTGCSLIADHFDGVIPHLNGHDVTLVAESIAPLEELRPYKQRMGWSLPWVSSARTDFNFEIVVVDFADDFRGTPRRLQLDGVTGGGVLNDSRLCVGVVSVGAGGVGEASAAHATPPEVPCPPPAPATGFCLLQSPDCNTAARPPHRDQKPPPPSPPPTASCPRPWVPPPLSHESQTA